MDREKLIEAALAVAAEGWPVFPTRDKKPAWSNADLSEMLGEEIDRGQGGYKVATTDPERIRQMFQRGTEIAVPTGKVSGAAVIDVDAYKAEGKKWLDSHRPVLQQTRSHSTRSGGFHFLYKLPQGRLPATLAPGVDVKGDGGYVCFPPTEGYKLLDGNTEILPFPEELLATKALSKTNGQTPPATGVNSVDDDELVRRILDADELYPALRALSWRMGMRKLSAEEIEGALERIMAASVAAAEGHPRHEDWLERRTKLGELALSAVEKQERQKDELVDGLALIYENQGGPLLPADTMDRLIKAALPAKRPVEVPLDAEETLDWGMPAEDLPLREWLLGNTALCGQLTVIGGQGGSNKSSLALMGAMSVSSGQAILGMRVHKCVNAMVINNEDPKSESKRRFVGIRDALMDMSKRPEHFIKIIGLPEQEGDKPVHLATLHENGELEFHEEVWDWLRTLIVSNNLGYLVLDPLVSLVLGPIENNNSAMHTLTARVRSLAFQTGCSIIIVAHNRKGSSEAERHDASMLRGASSLVDTARIVGMLSPMSKKEAKRIAGPKATAATIEKLSYKFRRYDIVKGNLSERQVAVWFEASSHQLKPLEDKVPVLRFIGTWSDLVDHLADIEASTIAPEVLLAAQLIHDQFGLGDHPLLKVFKHFRGNENWPLGTSTGGNNTKAVMAKFDPFIPLGNGVLVGAAKVRGKNVMHLFKEENQ